MFVYIIEKEQFQFEFRVCFSFPSSPAFPNYRTKTRAIYNIVHTISSTYIVKTTGTNQGTGDN